MQIRNYDLVSPRVSSHPPPNNPQGITTRSQAKAQQLAMATQQRHHVDGNNCKLDFEAAMNIM
jgi:hypothetical protein